MGTTQPAVTAVVPTHNRRDVLAVTLRSILEQRDVDLQVVVVDDGSEDGTFDWLASLEDPRLHPIRHDQARGVSAARSTGLAAATTPYVAFCDDDDLWAPTKVARQLEALAAAPGTRWSCTSAMSFVDGPQRVELTHCQCAPSESDLRRSLLARNVVPGGGSSVLAEAALVREVGGFRVVGVVEDWDLWIRLALAAPVASVAAPLTCYRVWRQANGSRSHQFRTLVESIGRVTDAYADEARRLGVEPDDLDHSAQLAKIALRCGLRREAFVRYARLGRTEPRKFLWALAALASPAEADRATDRRSARAVPAAQRRCVEDWLLPLLRTDVV